LIYVKQIYYTFFLIIAILSSSYSFAGWDNAESYYIQQDCEPHQVDWPGGGGYAFKGYFVEDGIVYLDTSIVYGLKKAWNVLSYCPIVNWYCENDVWMPFLQKYNEGLSVSIKPELGKQGEPYGSCAMWQDPNNLKNLGSQCIN